MNHTLKLFNTGQVTLPKSWRNKYNTKVFLAEETDKGLLIKPIIKDDVVYYENKEGFGIYSDNGIDPESIISKIKQLQNG
ncbi:MAG: AbrB/MazE/SpoVT family DNA-binding domain-containing protein [Candidatus Gracilibacteria bacterium]|nr:AbrB/MazE/SpoVT family DNA-binding domain-containing protein [Candidatus Gracilibacteria bacterium]